MARKRIVKEDPEYFFKIKKPKTEKEDENSMKNTTLETAGDKDGATSIPVNNTDDIAAYDSSQEYSGDLIHTEEGTYVVCDDDDEVDWDELESELDSDTDDTNSASDKGKWEPFLDFSKDTSRPSNNRLLNPTADSQLHVHISSIIVGCPLSEHEMVLAEVFLESIGRHSALNSKNGITVYLPRGISFSPFLEMYQLQLVTYLRMLKISHKLEVISNEAEVVPTMRFKDDDIYESNLCSELIKRVFSTKKHSEETADCSAKRQRLNIIFGKNLYFGILLWHWCSSKNSDIQKLSTGYTSTMVEYTKKKVVELVEREAKELLENLNVVQCIEDNIAIASSELGDNAFFFGSEPDDIDCAAFVLFTQLAWNTHRSPFRAQLLSYKNLSAFMMKMITLLWPEWPSGYPLPFIPTYIKTENETENAMSKLTIGTAGDKDSWDLICPDVGANVVYGDDDLLNSGPDVGANVVCGDDDLLNSDESESNDDGECDDIDGDNTGEEEPGQMEVGLEVAEYYSRSRHTNEGLGNAEADPQLHVHISPVILGCPISEADNELVDAFMVGIGRPGDINWENDIIVYLARGKSFSPCLELYQMQLATFLRMHDISHKFEVTSNETEQPPVIRINGYDIYDPKLCCELIKKVFSTYQPTELTADVAAKRERLNIILGKKMYFGILLWQWCCAKDFEMQKKSTEYSNSMVVSTKLKIHDLVNEEAREFWENSYVIESVKDSIAIASSDLGDNAFFFGSEPDEIDCAAFVLFSQLAWNTGDSPFRTEIFKHSNLRTLMMKMKNTLWPDWSDGCHLPFFWGPTQLHED